MQAAVGLGVDMTELAFGDERILWPGGRTVVQAHSRRGATVDDEAPSLGHAGQRETSPVQLVPQIRVAVLVDLPMGDRSLGRRTRSFPPRVDLPVLREVDAFKRILRVLHGLLFTAQLTPPWIVCRGARLQN